MANIYEFEQSFMTLWSLIEEGEIEDSVLEEAFENLTEDLKVKLENCCKYIKNEESMVSGLKEEEARLKAKRQAAENRITRLKALMQKCMETAGEKNLPCGTFKVAIQKNAPSVVIDEQYIENIPNKYLKVQEPEIDKTKLKEALKNGDEEAAAIAHLEQTESLRIR